MLLRQVIMTLWRNAMTGVGAARRLVAGMVVLAGMAQAAEITVMSSAATKEAYLEGYSSAARARLAIIDTRAR
jgi:hypothetical protein